MRYSPLFITILLLPGWALSVLAAEGRAAEPSAQPYTLPQVVTLAVAHHPSIAAAEGAVDQSQGQRVTASAYPNPTITGSAGRGSIRDPSTGVSITERTITVEQPIEWAGKRTARQQVAEAGLAGARAGVEETRLTLLADVKTAFYQLLFAQQDASLAKQNLKTAEDLMKVVGARVGTREAPKFEAIKANVEMQKARKEVTRAENALVVARVKLDTLTGKALGEHFAVQGEFEVFRQSLDLKTLVRHALDQHPAIRRQQRLVEQAGFTVEQERASRMPDISVQGTYHREAGDEAITAGLSVPIPIWYRRQGEIGTALGTQRRAQAERTRLQQELEQAVTQYYQEVHTAQGQIQVFEQGLLNQAKEALEIAQFSFQHGVVNLLDVLDAQRVYRQTLLEYAQTRSDLSIALARLERSAGGLP